MITIITCEQADLRALFKPTGKIIMHNLPGGQSSFSGLDHARVRLLGLELLALLEKMESYRDKEHAAVVQDRCSLA